VTTITTRHEYSSALRVANKIFCIGYAGKQKYLSKNKIISAEIENVAMEFNIMKIDFNNYLGEVLLLTER
jgi:hypothetical protein